MKISNPVKNFLVGFPIVVMALILLGFMITWFGSEGLLIIALLCFFGLVGVVLGEAIRDNFKIWK